MNYMFPIKYFEENLIFNTGRKECWALYEIDGFNYDFKSNEKKIAILNALARFISNIGGEAKVLMVPVSQDIDKHYKRIMNGLDARNPMCQSAKAHAEGTAAYLRNKLKGRNNMNDYKTYVVTKLKLPENLVRDAVDAFTYLYKEPVQVLKEAFGVEYKDIFKREIESFRNLANEYLRRQSKRVSLTACDEYDTQWLIRRPFFRGLGEVQLRGDEESRWTPFTLKVIKDGEAALRSEQREILTLTEGLVDVEDERLLKVFHGDGRVSYQAFLAISHIPDGIIFPGNEWLLELQDYEVQTEVCINIETVIHKESIRNVGRKKKEIDDQIQHTEENNEDIPDELLESKENARDLEAELRASRSPITRTSITVCFFSDSREELEENVSTIKEIYEDKNFIMERPMSDQLKLFMEFFPGTGRYVTDYIMPLPPRTLAGAMFGATRIIGDNAGPYIGTTGLLQKNVYLDIKRACLLNRSASAAFLGTLGGGKSFNANLLFYLNVLYGGYGLVLDPKGERSNWEKDLPEFAGQMNIISLSAEEKDKGKLDPFLIYKGSMDEAGYLAVSILSELFKLNPKDDEYTAILEAIEWMKKQDKPSMIKLAGRLLDFPEEDSLKGAANRIGRKIKLLRNMAMAGLLFGEGGEESLSFDKRVNVLQIQNLSMPDPEKPKDDYTQEEVLSTVLMLPIASFARKFLHMSRQVFKVVLFDEAWALSSTTQGQQTMNALVREGRALNAGCFFIGHSTKDMRSEGIKTNISYKFCFKATDNAEIARILEFLDLEATDENMNEVKNLRNGECLFQDLDGRVGKLKFDAVYSHLIEKAFNTTPTGDAA